MHVCNRRQALTTPTVVKWQKPRSAPGVETCPKSEISAIGNRVHAMFLVGRPIGMLRSGRPIRNSARLCKMNLLHRRLSFVDDPQTGKKRQRFSLTAASDRWHSRCGWCRQGPDLLHAASSLPLIRRGSDLPRPSSVQYRVFLRRRHLTGRFLWTE